ncbi:hypothetical protein SanaruYs_39500 [Chryseotalea sanaruensis]|uniref:Uncharacterized protein n=1 Tax=Chryseotalea sanaruensis TaxID=2482724 RepID=A0A401UFL4_9BACT|nr:hypothetical protein [Chryseotalea sanaruensis]GCC53705.1 hypothetical protein SanaruYs_39500 [Chryseotalea sanaruensis]
MNNDNIAFYCIIGVALFIAYLVRRDKANPNKKVINNSGFKKEHLGIGVLIISWELISYVFSSYFFPLDNKDYSGKWVKEFNEELFIALSIIGLAILLVYIGYKLIKQK